MPSLKKITVRTVRKGRPFRAPRRKQVVVVRAPKKQVRARRSRRSAGRMPGMSTPAAGFTACVFGDVGTPPHKTGVPDGDNNLSFVVDHRQTFVIPSLTQTQPATGVVGDLAFAIHPSPLGAVCPLMGYTGPFVAAIENIDAATGNILGPYNATLNNPTTGATYPAGNYGIIPFSEWLAAGGNITTTRQGAKLDVQRFRVLSNKARVVYTGNDFYNSGTVAVCRQDISVDKIVQKPTTDGQVHAFGQYRQLLTSEPPRTFNDVASVAGAQLYSVAELRGGLDLLNVPYKWDYQGWQEDSTPVVLLNGGNTDGQFAQLRIQPSSIDLGFCCAPGIGYAPTTFVFASGMGGSTDTGSAGQGLTITAQTCVQYTVSFSSPMARFANTGTDNMPGVLDGIKTAARDLPPAKKADEGWFSKALNWYGGAMKDVYQAVTGTATQLVTGHNIWETGHGGQALAGIANNAMANSRGNKRRRIR